MFHHLLWESLIVEYLGGSPLCSSYKYYLHARFLVHAPFPGLKINCIWMESQKLGGGVGAGASWSELEGLRWKGVS